MSEVELRVTDDGVGEVVMNRPEVKNAINGPFGVALAGALREASAREEVRVVLLRGEGGAFCSGLDLKAFNADPAPAWVPEFQTIWREAHKSLFECQKPIIGALERYAINGGAALAVACDLLVTDAKAFLQVGEVQIGMAAPYNMAWLSLRHNEAVMAQIALVGDRLSGAELAHLGLAYRLAEEDQTGVIARELAERLAGFPEGGLVRIKAGLRVRLELDADAWFDQFTGPDPVGASPKPRSMKS